MTQETNKLMVPSTTTNIKHNPTPRQINTKIHTNASFTSVPINQYIISSFQKKIIRHAMMVNVLT